MFIIRGLRVPTALAFGLLSTAAIFWSLWSLTNVTFQIKIVDTVPIEFAPILEDRPPVKKAEPEKIVPPPVVPPIDPGRLNDPTVDKVFPLASNLPVDAPDIERTVFGFARDSDVVPLVRINPEYPPRAQAQGIEGWVKVQYTISGTGAVTNVVVVENNPSNVFDAAAVKAVSRWRFSPKVEGTVAVERVGMQTVLRFNLEE